MNKVTSFEIKTSLISYFRFQRQWLCAEEVQFAGGLADILSDTGEDIIEVEVKLTKNDLYRGEKKKEKHITGIKSNRFYICAPSYLINDVLKWVEETNKNYGVIEYQSYLNLVIRRSAKPFNRPYDLTIRKKIEMRLSSMLYTYMNKICHDLQLNRDGCKNQLEYKDAP